VQEGLEFTMPSTYTSLHYHLVFSTKNRVPLIDTDCAGGLHEYLGGTVRGLGGVPETIGVLPIMYIYWPD